jgi:hypothetical protein
MSLLLKLNHLCFFVYFPMQTFLCLVMFISKKQIKRVFWVHHALYTATDEIWNFKVIFNFTNTDVKIFLSRNKYSSSDERLFSQFGYTSVLNSYNYSFRLGFLSITLKKFSNCILKLNSINPETRLRRAKPFC